MRKIIADWLSWFGVIAGSLSLISAITRILDIGLSGVFAEMVAFYRNITKPIFDLLAIFHLEMTRLQADMVLVYLVLLMMSVRAGVLPLFKPEILASERDRFGETYTQVGEIEGENFPANMMAAERLPDGSYEMMLRRYKPDWLLYLRAALSTAVLAPIFTLLPFRRALPSSKGSSPDGPGPLRVLTYAFSLTENDKRGGMKEVTTNSFYNVNYLLTLKSYFITGIQAACLPLAAVLFFILAKYSHS